MMRLMYLHAESALHEGRRAGFISYNPSWHHRKGASLTRDHHGALASTNMLLILQQVFQSAHQQLC